MNKWVGSVILVGLVAGCDTPPDIYVRVFKFPREEADYRISTVLQGRRVAPAIQAHVDPPFTSQPPVVAEPDTELRLSPGGPLPRFERVCFDLQRRGRWPEPVRSTRICTRFEKDKHLRQDVYFNWHFTYESGGGGDDCPQPAPNCCRLNERERSMLEAMTAAPTSEALADPSLIAQSCCRYSAARVVAGSTHTPSHAKRSKNSRALACSSTDRSSRSLAPH